MNPEGETRTARCHCGAVIIEAYLPFGLSSATRCNCSFCRRRGAAAVTAQSDRVKVLSGADALTLYSWGTGAAQHYFCKVCGIYTHHKRRIDPKETGINLGCFDGVLPQEHEPIPTTDGINHPSDRNPNR
ncbi:MAG: GFA family protein [Roseobacter sp.]